MRATFILLLTSLTSAFPQQNWRRIQPDTGSAAYFLENDPAGNNIVSLEIASDGSLSNPTRIPTGGYGSSQVNASGFPNAADTLGSQGSVTVVDDWIFAVNAGSNTVSMFSIAPEDPRHPQLVGKPVGTLGQFPISVDYSPRVQKACVLNGGAVAGVACFSVDPVRGLRADGSLHAIPKTIIMETTPPSGPPGSAAQVLFAPDSSAIFATVKGNAGASPVKLGSLLAWPLNGGQISNSEPVVTQLPGITMDFGFTFIDNKIIFLADPSFGISLLSVKQDLTVTETRHTVIPGQSAICWTAYSPATNLLYAIDAGLNKTGSLVGSIAVSDVDGMIDAQGVFDSAVSDGLMYSLTAANGVSVINLQKQQQVQFLDLSHFGVRKYYMGMAVWPSSTQA
ncbi:hypothetical protein LTR82_018182 [Friedmanniomyces endolithicus]|uniref:3-carboxymuconate cyclase n=1 Tax=Friedmanniomyces endolithicus TaxID=329885 RepID=A0AAN6F4C5_9PEZI|nr:hypothetical protein LTR82_018182 [Friedmanniomyces endolithicus]